MGRFKRSDIFAGKKYRIRIKGTSEITGWLPLRVLICVAVRHLDVGLAYPAAAQGRKGFTVRKLKRYTSWVQTDESQVGFYLLLRKYKKEMLKMVRKDL